MKPNIQEMFGTIAPAYDATNTILSLGWHKRWNHSLVSSLSPYRPRTLLDLCAGTGEIAFSFLKQSTTSNAILLDFCPEMLAVADEKGKSFNTRFQTIVGDAQELTLPAESVDAVTIAYGIRNIENPLQAAREIKRVLRPNGVLAILELTRPTNRFLHLMHRFYLTLMVPILGKLSTKNKEAYKYLAKSILSFLSPEELIASLESVGFTLEKKKSLMGGIAHIIVVKKGMS